MFLETERLKFRSHEARDEPDFVAMHTDVAVRRYVGGKPWTREKAVARFAGQYLWKPTDVFGLWATIYREEDRYIGACGLTRADGAIHLGYYIARPYWGRGLATEAARAFVDVAFSRLNLPRVCADVEKGHVASQHVLEKLGFAFTMEEAIAGSARVIRHYELLPAA